MRIAFITTIWGYDWGGSEELWANVAEKALDDGHEVLISIFETSRDAKRIQQLKARGAKIVERELFRAYGGYVNRISKFVREKISLRTGKDLRDVADFKPDSICVNLASTYDILLRPELRAFLGSSDIPYGFICQGHVDVPFSSNEWRLIVKESFEKASWIGFVSAANLQSAERHLATELKNARVVQNPAKLSNLDYVPFPKSMAPLRFANVARFDPVQKSQDLLFEALGDPTWKERDWILDIAGSGPHEDYLRALVEFYGIDDKVRFLGQVEDLQALWSENHLLFLPSRFEGTPLSLIEAMVCGRTALVTDVAGNCEWISGDIGFVAAAPSKPYILDALNRVWENRERLEELGSKCRERAVRLYNPRMADDILDALVESKT
jgi:glycosyltransferase involved in cell wall biosynthesis